MMAMLNSCSLLTCGDNVCVWDLTNFSLLHEFSLPASHSFTSVAWQSDNQFVSIPSEQNKLVFSELLQTEVKNSIYDISFKATVACYNQSSKYAAVGSATGEIFCWDTQSNKIAKTIAENSSGVTCLHYNFGDSHVASGCLDGNAFLHNVTSGVTTSVLKTGKAENSAIRCVQYNPYSKFILASCCDQGQVSLWDVNRQCQYRNITDKHRAPAMEAKFSPLSNVILASVGLDKRIMIHDFKEKKLVHNIQCEIPLRTVEFMADGITVIVGGSKGMVCVYDLRSTSKTIKTFTAHSTAVQKLAINFNRKKSTKSQKNKGNNEKNILMPSVKTEPHCNHRFRESTNSTDDETAISTIVNITLPTENPLIPVSIAEEIQDPFSPLRSPAAVVQQQISENNENVPLRGDTTGTSIDITNGNLPSGFRVKEEPNLNQHYVEDIPAQLQNENEDQVLEAVEETRMTLHMDIMSMFMQMIKQFTVVQNQIRELQDKCEMNQEILEELQNLREENKRLKSSY